MISQMWRVVCNQLAPLMMCILLGVAALANAEVQARSDDFATGKIPVEGSLSVNFASPRVDTNIILYFSVTPLESDDVWTQFLLPENLVPIKNEVVEKKFPQVKAFETVTHTLKVRVLSEDRMIVRAVAAITGKEEDGIYTSAITLWASLSQVLHEGKQRSCLAAVSRVMVLLVALGREPGKKHSGPYCRARAKLSEAFLDDLTLQVAHGCEKKFQPRDLWCNRPVKLADGTNWGFAIWDFKISY